jgi:hypothetical protein
MTVEGRLAALAATSFSQPIAVEDPINGSSAVADSSAHFELSLGIKFHPVDFVDSPISPVALKKDCLPGR